MRIFDEVGRRIRRAIYRNKLLTTLHLIRRRPHAWLWEQLGRQTLCRLDRHCYHAGPNHYPTERVKLADKHRQLCAQDYPLGMVWLEPATIEWCCRCDLEIAGPEPWT